MRSSLAVALALLLVVGLLVWLLGWLPGGERVAPGSSPGSGAAAAVARTEAGPAAGQPGSEREAVATPGAAEAEAAPVAETPDAATPTGQLLVLVRAERGEALAGCTVHAGEHERTTGRDGRAEFELEAKRWFVRVAPPAGRDLQPGAGWQNVRVGETTTVEIVLASVVRTTFWCRLVAAEDDRPLAGAEARVEPAGERARSDAGGYLQVAVMDEGTWLDVTADGRSPRRVLPTADHPSRDSALKVQLPQGCSLRALVTDTGSAPVAGFALELRARPWSLQAPTGMRARGEDTVWTATSDLEGRLSIDGLPVGVLLAATARVPAGFAAFPEEYWSFTELREERTIVLDAGGAVHGVVVDGEGQPVADVPVQATASEGGPMPRVLGLTPEQYRTTSAADGTFRIGGLGPGTWLVGIPYGSYRPTSVAVELPPGGRADVELRAFAGLAVVGRALAPDGGPAPGVPLDLHVDDEYVASTRTDAEGRFRFGHLPEGTCQLSVDVFETNLGLPAPVSVTAGDEDVELRLLAVFGTISGRIFGGERPWVSAHLRGGFDALGAGSDLNGSFRLRGMRPGTWDLKAQDRAGGVAIVTGVVVVGGAEVEGLVLELRPGAILRPRHGSADEFVVRRGAEVVGNDSLQPGVPGESRVPAGAYTVVFLKEGREIGRREVVAEAGKELVVDG